MPERPRTEIVEKYHQALVVKSVASVAAESTTFYPLFYLVLYTVGVTRPDLMAGPEPMTKASILALLSSWATLVSLVAKLESERAINRLTKNHPTLENTPAPAVTPKNLKTD